MSLNNLPNQLEYVAVEKCRLCESTDLSVVLDLPDTPFGDQYLPPGQGAEHANLIPLKIVQCAVCNNFQTSVVVNVNSMNQYHLSRPGAVNKTLSDSYRDYAEHLYSLLKLNTADLVVEICKYDDLFASFFANNGTRCIGVDPARNLSETAKSRGVDTISEFFGQDLAEKILRDHGSARLVVANFMVANVTDLDDFMIGVKKLLAQDGIFAMETNYALDIVDKFQLEVINHEHISYFSVTSLSKFIEKYDLEIFVAKRVPSKSGSLRCYIRHKDGKSKVDDSVSNAKLFEEHYGLFMPSVWKSMTSTVEHVSAVSRKYLSARANSGIAAYGSSIGATTLLYSLKIGEFFRILIDDDPYRQDLESPGFAIPTASRENILFQPPDIQFCAVLAPRYVSQIVSNNQQAIESGVKFLRVWPVFEEIPYHPWRGETATKYFER